MILVFSHPADDHAAGVLAALARTGHPAALVDTALYPKDGRLTHRLSGDGEGYDLALNGHRIDLRAARVGWWRRPQPFTLDPALEAKTASFAYSECHEAVAGLWAALDLTWVNPPALDEAAHHKPYQLAVACRVGLPIPRTVITNDPVAAEHLIGELGPARTIYKTFLASEDCWRETRIVRPEEVSLLDRVRLAPVIFQEYVEAVADIRVTVVGDEIFATAVTPAPGGYAVDYRMDLGGAQFTPTSLAAETEHKLRALMDRLGLVYGAIDLRRTAAGDEIFLEINPAGEWQFVEERSGQPITEAVAALLARLDQ